jgi:predicted RNA-binding protein YlqC (UPF0109 family)
MASEGGTASRQESGSCQAEKQEEDGCGAYPRHETTGIIDEWNPMEEFISFIVKHLVTDPDAVSVERVEKEGDVVYRLRVGDGDLGQVIGKEGRTAKSLRILLIASAARAGQRARLEIVDPAKERDATPHP